MFLAQVGAFATPWEQENQTGMIQLIVIAFLSLWLAWGAINILIGIAQIFMGIASGIAAIALYSLAAVLELMTFIYAKTVSRT